MRAGGGGGGMRMGGGGGGRGGGGGGGARRSDISVKHDIAFLGRLDNGLGFYRFSYIGSDKGYVGVMAQEVQFVRPDAVSRDEEGILRVDYDRLGVRFQTYDQWLGSGARVRCGSRLTSRTGVHATSSPGVTRRGLNIFGLARTNSSDRRVAPKRASRYLRRVAP